MVSTTIFHDVCPRCGGDLCSSLSRYAILIAVCLQCGFHPSEDEYKEMCEKEERDARVD